MQSYPDGGSNYKGSVNNNVDESCKQRLDGLKFVQLRLLQSLMLKKQKEESILCHCSTKNVTYAHAVLNSQKGKWIRVVQKTQPNLQLFQGFHLHLVFFRSLTDYLLLLGVHSSELCNCQN